MNTRASLHQHLHICQRNIVQLNHIYTVVLYCVCAAHLVLRAVVNVSPGVWKESPHQLNQNPSLWSTEQCFVFFALHLVWRWHFTNSNLKLIKKVAGIFLLTASAKPRCDSRVVSGVTAHKSVGATAQQARDFTWWKKGSADRFCACVYNGSMWFDVHSTQLDWPGGQTETMLCCSMNVKLELLE